MILKLSPSALATNKDMTPDPTGYRWVTIKVPTCLLLLVVGGSFYLSMHSFIYSSIYLSFNLSMHSSIYLSIYLFIHLSIYLSFFYSSSLLVYISTYHIRTSVRIPPSSPFFLLSSLFTFLLSYQLSPISFVLIHFYPFFFSFFFAFLLFISIHCH